MTDPPAHPTTDTGADTTSRELVVPYSGEVIDLGGPLEELASLVYGIRELESELRTMKAILSEEVHRRMDERARWTLEAGRYRVVGASPSRVTYDVDALDMILEELVTTRRIAREAADAALERVVTLRARPSGIAALRRLGGDVAARIAGAEIPIDPDSRRVNVSVKR